MRPSELVSPWGWIERLLNPCFSLMDSQQKVTRTEKEPKHCIINNKPKFAKGFSTNRKVFKFEQMTQGFLGGTLIPRTQNNLQFWRTWHKSTECEHQGRTYLTTVVGETPWIWGSRSLTGTCGFTAAESLSWVSQGALLSHSCGLQGYQYQSPRRTSENPVDRVKLHLLDWW